jgi:hypothetical protein
VVHISHCSGDVFGGNVTRPYTDKLGKPVQQKGLSNVQSALDWVKAQQTSGKLSRTLSELVIGGASAGSVGAQLWSSNGKQFSLSNSLLKINCLFILVLSTLKWTKAAVVPDSYAG